MRSDGDTHGVEGGHSVAPSHPAALVSGTPYPPPVYGAQNYLPTVHPQGGYPPSVSPPSVYPPGGYPPGVYPGPGPSLVSPAPHTWSAIRTLLAVVAALVISASGAVAVAAVDKAPSDTQGGTGPQIPGIGQFGNGQFGNGQFGNGQVGNGQFGNGQVGNGQFGNP